MKKDLMLSIIQKRWIMLCLFVMMCVFGYYSWTQLSIEAYPDIAEWLKPVFEKLDEKTLQQLNASIAVEGLDAKKVAADFLKQQGLVK